MKLSRLCVPLLVLVSLEAPGAWAFNVDGSGHYALRGRTVAGPAFQPDAGTYQALDQSFFLNGEVRVNDNLSAFLGMRLFDQPLEGYLGAKPSSQECQNQNGATSSTCTGKSQDPETPGYAPYVPRFTEAYVRYAFDYCLLDAGRRPRDWGLGVFLNSGHQPFQEASSVFDGVTCNVNIQKTQTLGFSIGYDKLAESSAPLDPSLTAATSQRKFGPTDPNDDLSQYFFTIQYDDRKANAGSPFTKQIGVYFAQVQSPDYKVSDDNTRETGGSGTDIKFLDLYTGFYMGDLTFRNELLFRMGKSADPAFQELGGAQYAQGTLASNKVDSIALAGDFEWTISHAGAPVGPAEYNKGDLRQHSAFIQYAYSPGDEDGYLQNYAVNGDPTTMPQGLQDKYTAVQPDHRGSAVKALPFSRNYQPALLLFNAPAMVGQNLAVDGAFSPWRVMDATLVAAGYRYKSFENGNVEAKLLTAMLNQSPPGVVHDYFEAIKGTAYDTGKRPVGYFSRSLGYELDLTYSYNMGRDATVGGAAAAALPGDAWKTSITSKPVNSYLVEAFATFHL